MFLTPSEARERVTIGWWFAPCCIEDLHPIEAADELADLLRDYEEDCVEFGGYGGWAGFWPTKAAALLDLK